MEHCENRRRRISGLVSAWSQANLIENELLDERDDLRVEAVAEPMRRSRTPLTEADVDAMRTAKASGVSVTVLAKRFGVHRGTVWAKTR